MVQPAVAAIETYHELAGKMADALPHEWKKVESRSRPGHCYYLNKKTGEKQWEIPGVKRKSSSAGA